jgi:hypothetical protein
LLLCISLKKTKILCSLLFFNTEFIEGLILGRTAAEKFKYSEIIQIFRKNPKIPVYSFDILKNPFRKILLIFPKNPKIPLIFPKILNIPKNPQKSSKFSKILKKPQNSQKSSKFPKILKIPKNPQKSQKSSKIH